MPDDGKPLTKADLEAAPTALKDDLTEFIRQIETNLLAEFHRYGKGQHETPLS